MPRALHKANEPSDIAAKVAPVATPDLGGVDTLTDPLHPMHRELLARILAPPVVSRKPERLEFAPARGKLAGPVRMAIIFYAALAAWGGVWLLAESVVAVV